VVSNALCVFLWVQWCPTHYVCFCEYSGVQRIMCVFESTVVSNALCVFLWVQWCPTHYVCFCEYSGVQRIMRVFVSTVVSNAYCIVFCSVFRRLVYPMMRVSLDCPFLIAPSVFRNFSSLVYCWYILTYIHLTFSWVGINQQSPTHFSDLIYLMLKNTEGAIKNGQSRETRIIGYTRVKCM
jgi:hypothetical protein